MRYFIRLSYRGSDYHGWQNQPNAVTVQQVLEEALSTVLRGSIAVVGAGRTDTGVHAKEMYAHFDTDVLENPGELVQKLNRFLPHSIAVHDILEVKADAHARFDASERTYEYWVTQRKNAFLQEFAHYVNTPLNLAAMNEAAAILMEYEDFECFSKSNSDVKTFLCTIRHAAWEQHTDKLVFTISANRFLRNMVRAIVGTLLEVGLGKKNKEAIRAIIASKDRSRAGVSVPAKGLYLTKVSYPETLFA